MTKRILITGGGGFIGHHFVQYVLDNTDWEIIALYRDNIYRIPDSPRIYYIKVDLSDNLDRVIEYTNRLDYVVHMAAETYVDDSLTNCIKFVNSNVLGTANLLEWLKNNHPQAKICMFSSDEVMGPAPEGVYFKEDDLPKPSNPYAATKAAAESLAYSFAHSFGMDIFTIRCMNVFGENESWNKFIPKTFKSIKDGKKIILHGTSQDDVASRHWVHAKDVADAVLFLLKHAMPKQTYHIAGEERDVYWLANKIYYEMFECQMPDEVVEFIDFHDARPGHDKRYSLSNQKLLDMGWESKHSIDQSIKDLVKNLEGRYKNA